MGKQIKAVHNTKYWTDVVANLVMNDISIHASLCIDHSALFCNMEGSYQNAGGDRMENVRNDKQTNNKINKKPN